MVKLPLSEPPATAWERVRDLFVGTLRTSLVVAPPSAPPFEEPIPALDADDDVEDAVTEVVPGALPQHLPHAPADMAWIPAGPVSVDGVRALVRPFLLDRTAVTNEAWRAFVEATGAPPPSHWLHRRPPPGMERHPVVGITVEEAASYAAWRGRRLPTHAEWLVALPDPRPPCGAGRCHCRAATTAPVDAIPAGVTPEGVTGLLGNVWEWTTSHPGTPPPSAGCVWALGGSFRHGCATVRTIIHAGKASPYVGFRCAADAPEVSR